MILNGTKTAETAGAFLRDAESLMAQLDTDGKELAIEYMEYLVSTGKYPAEGYHKPQGVPVTGSPFMA